MIKRLAFVALLIGMIMFYAPSIYFMIIGGFLFCAVIIQKLRSTPRHYRFGSGPSAPSWSKH